MTKEEIILWMEERFGDLDWWDKPICLNCEGQIEVDHRLIPYCMCRSEEE